MTIFTIFLLHPIFLLWGVSFSVATTDLGNETDRLALLAFKSQLTKNPQNALTSWNDSLLVCRWEGITCGRKHQRVVTLDLMSKGLGGQISPHIGNLSFLRVIELFNNSFHGEIPQELGGLFRLEMLSLGKNSLVGEIPGNISKCSNLKSLQLPSNNLSGKIPTELGSLAKLVDLSLGDNNITGGIPPSLGNLTSLQIIDLSQNDLGGSIPSTLHLLRNLKEFYFTLCNLSGKLPPFLYSNLSTIEIFSLAVNQLTGSFRRDTVINLPNLQFLYAALNQFSGDIPTSLFNSSRVQRIDIFGNQFTGKVPAEVGNLKMLSGLNFGLNGLGSAQLGDLDFLTALTNCSRLQILGLFENNFGGMLPVSIGNFSNQFQLFYLQGNQISGTIPREVGNVQSLTGLFWLYNLFSGRIPKEIGNLQNLQSLDLSHNQLSGPIPSSMSKMSKLYHLDLSYNSLAGSVALALDNQNLQIIYLSHNNLTGALTERNTRLSARLITLDIAYNHMTGSIPLVIGTLNTLGALNLSHNKFSGEIPSSLGSCSSLEHLNLQANLFHGHIPTSLSSIKGLQDLDLSNNNFSGEIPKELENLSSLVYFNLSYNLLEGEVPNGGVFRNASAFSIVGNNKTCGGVSQLKLPRCYILKSKRHRSTLAFRVVLGVVIPSFLVMLFLVIYMWKSRKAKHPSEPHQVDLHRVSYLDLHKATDGFSAVNLIGTGSYGSVYKGILQQDDALVAVKVFNLLESGASRSFIRECEALRELRHRNLLKILTVCSSVDLTGNDFKALVFEFKRNGSLESWLHPSSIPPRSLNFNQRLTIAMDIAAALNYLHNDSEMPIVHCDIKASNILLNEDMTACVADFGLAKFLTKITSSSKETETSSIAVRGTIGYIPPEYGMGAEVSPRADVYSYGILLLEMFTGKRPTDQLFKDGLSLHDYCKSSLPQRVLDIVDTSASHEEPENISPNSLNQMKECFIAVIGIGIACSMEQMERRMDIKHVLKELHSVQKVSISLSSHEQTLNSV